MFCARLFICALWSPAGKGLTSWLSFVVSSVSLSLSHWYPGSGVVLDCIDSWSLQPYYLDEFQKSKWFRLHAPTQHFCTSNHGFAVHTMQQQTSFFIRNDTYVKLLYLKRKNEIGIYIRCNYQTTTDFFRHNKWYHCKLSLYLWNTKKYQTQKCRINETVLLGTQNIKPWLQIWLPCIQFL